MSKERDLLKKVVVYMWEGELVDEIEELLAQPEQEPLSDEEITKNTPKMIHIGERIAFAAGVRFAEKMQCIGVDDEN